MALEQSHGKARPTLPRSGELAAVPDADGERCGQRDEHGRFATGNIVGRGRGWKRAIAKMLGRTVEDPIAQAVADDAWRLFTATVRELPSDGPTVRGLAASRARHAALEAFWSTQAVGLGLTTVEGIAADERATKHGQRAERLAVTMLDVSTRMAKTRPTKAGDTPWLVPDDETSDAEPAS
jgi:hypothetical protein